MSRGLYRVPQQNAQRGRARAKALPAVAEDSGPIAIGENSTPSRRDEEKAPQRSFWDRLTAQFKGSRTSKSETDAKSDSSGGSANASTLTSGSVEPPAPPGPVFRVSVPASSRWIVTMDNSGSPRASRLEVTTRMPESDSRMNLGESVPDRTNLYNWLHRMVKLVDADDDMFITDVRLSIRVLESVGSIRDLTCSRLL